MSLHVYQRSLDGVLEEPIISPNKEYIQNLMQADLNKMPAELHVTIDEDGTITYVETAEYDFSKYWEIETPSATTPNEIHDIIPIWNMLSPEWQEIFPSYIEKQFTIVQHITYEYETIWDKKQSFELCLNVYAGDHVSGKEDEENDENGIYCDCNKDDVEWRTVECKDHGEINDLPFSDYAQGHTMFVHVLKDHCTDLQNEYPKIDPSSLIAVHNEIIKLLYQKE